ncbi:DnaB-like helicase N-terminal domain-containing protein [Streptomyces sp. NPDC003077]|uniref:DnaB-like helicase N-terminal domain-containing protein n=1 Tax=Streptomyces sp. NPDC003077 TaxID=3154443 RepID=UPI0033B28435
MPHPTDPPPHEPPDDPAPPTPVHYAEQALLGALLLTPQRLADLGPLTAQHFTDRTHGALFTALRTSPAPDPEHHRTNPAWLTTVLNSARPMAPGLTPSYLHTLIQTCPRPRHAAAYARLLRTDHARRTLRTHAQHLADTAADPTLPDPVAATLAQADALARFLEDLTGQFPSHPGSLPRTTPPPTPPRVTSEEDLEEERYLLASATAHPTELTQTRWLQPEDFALPLHGTLWQCLTTLAHRAQPIDPITLMWEAQHHGLLTSTITSTELMTLLSTPVGTPEHWAQKIFQRALLARAHTVATRITAYTDDPANTPHQLITGSRRALADLTTLRARRPQPTKPTKPPRVGSPRAGPPPSATTPAARAGR